MTGQLQAVPDVEPPAVRGTPALVFNRREFAGAFGDIGTDFPLLAGMLLVTGLEPSSVFLVFGLMQVATGWFYRAPMPVQPLKVVAALVIAQKLPASLVLGAGLSIGIAMLLLVGSGLLDWLDRVLPMAVVRGIQLGLGLKLASLAVCDYIPSGGWPGAWLVLGGLLLWMAFRFQRYIPPVLPVLAFGVVYAAATKWGGQAAGVVIDLSVPQFHMPSIADIGQGFLLLALPQLPLSIGNSIYATRQTLSDLFPERRVPTRVLGCTFSLLNMIAPFLGGVPVCHGAGGLAGHYLFGARTGGSVVIYGLFLAIPAFFCASGVQLVVRTFPLPLLGVILFFEALVMMGLPFARHRQLSSLAIAGMVGIIAVTVPYGFVIGMIAGIGANWIMARKGSS